MGGGKTGLDGLKTAGRNLDCLNANKQNKHIPGTKEYVPGKSTITIPIAELERMVKDNLHKGIVHQNGGITIELPKVIGMCVTKDGIRIPTNVVTVHPSKTGYHFVPSAPKK